MTEKDKIPVAQIILKTYEGVNKIFISVGKIEQKMEDHEKDHKDNIKPRLDKFSDRLRLLDIKVWGLIGGAISMIGIYFGFVKK